MSVPSLEVAVDMQEVAIDGLIWLKRHVKDHAFGSDRSRNGSAYAAHSNNNLSITVKRAVLLRFVERKTEHTLGVPVGTEVVVYRQYDKAHYGDAVATFFIPDGRQVTLRKGGRLSVKQLG